MITKYAIEATMMTPVVTCDRFASFTRPVTKAITTTTTITTAASTAHLMPLRGSGFGTSRPCSPRFFLKKTYCARPSAIPTAAAPKPQWKPMRVCSRPVISGPTNAPRFIPR